MAARRRFPNSRRCGRLLAVAYRLTGSFADAEDARCRTAGCGGTDWRPPSVPASPLRAWLTTVVTGYAWTGCARGAAARPTWAVAAGTGGDPIRCRRPAGRRGRERGRRFAAMVVLDRLARSAGCVRPCDGFGVPFAERSPGARDDGCRGSSAGLRARRAVNAARTGSRSSAR